MAINNPEAIRFSNEKVRVAANRLAQAYNFSRAALDEWYARNMGAQFPVGGGIVEDGATSDGRPVIDGNDVTLLVSRLSELTTDYEADSNAKLNTILKIAPNPQSQA